MLLLLVPNPVFIFRYVCISLTPRTERRQQQKLKVLPHSDTNPSTPTHPPTQCNNSTPMTRKKGSKKAAASVKVTTVGVSDPHADMDTQVLDIVPNTNTNSNNSSSSSYNQSSPHPTLPASSTPVPVPPSKHRHRHRHITSNRVWPCLCQWEGQRACLRKSAQTSPSSKRV